MVCLYSQPPTTGTATAIYLAYSRIFRQGFRSIVKEGGAFPLGVDGSGQDSLQCIQLTLRYLGTSQNRKRTRPPWKLNYPSTEPTHTRLWTRNSLSVEKTLGTSHVADWLAASSCPGSSCVANRTPENQNHRSLRGPAFFVFMKTGLFD